LLAIEVDRARLILLLPVRSVIFAYNCQGFEKTVEEAIASVKDSLNEHVFQTFNATIPQAVNAAANTASGWGAHRSVGGMYWATYKATVRRNGVYSGASGPRDFNSELFDPVSRNLATGKSLVSPKG
jgi:hypothetical protein